MNAHLKASLQSAQQSLPEAGQEALAQMIEAFILNWDRDPKADFSATELAEIRQLDAEPFVEADPAEVSAFFARHAS